MIFFVSSASFSAPQGLPMTSKYILIFGSVPDGLTVTLMLEVDFPDRGFLLFWQLPLADKLKYFEIEEDIIKLKNISDTENRKKELDQLLLFLGANPVEKIDKAFRAKFGSGVLEYLDLK